MSKKINEVESTEQPVTQNIKEFSKSAFVDAATSTKEQLIAMIVLEEDKKYTRESAKKTIDEWKKKEVK
ncbi:hypothetical protein PVJ1_00069 [Psychrobacillus phage PVJ1]|nr:hypothetical protein PVJ1_00069 [Psychrobacillus phage PVJ1]